MANRHLARSIVLQTLYEWDFRKFSRERASVLLKRNIDEFAPGLTDADFLGDLLSNILAKQDDLDRIIEKAAPDWPLDRIGVVDRNVLRLGLFELLFANKAEVPAKVAINEAIELAKTFGGENSGKFVNGVLGSVYKEIGEPGKDATPRKKEVAFEKMLIQNLVGAVVYAREGKEVYLAFVHDIFGHWTLTKGKLLSEEDVKVGAVRKIKEEIGIDVNLKDELGRNEYIASDPELGKIRKQVHYFLAESSYTELTLKKTGGLDNVKWFKMGDILELNFYDDILPIVTKAINLLLKK
ncbi:MAG: transcription antitermination factor NusB [Candidatus Taylorbacteria bacterium CG11_big_fil_rev_8_21_14_0_20_46_11]|uniref:Transcription antitermination protein NusB n=1 Tax=Candidatus Taylorbacteria bacterium CG11_big_fil_rev_8_21_14_0_20_46_11 TaxID=1975025 RepID=A0A2H0KAY4_9BACT|nr:MAG: transcription antitermination factor NusB [Candidatus Taylorbacteria bacterium CG11_big_fil_rev_8_21_14_0_20_46_11]